jgi:hypothetical protein
MASYLASELTESRALGAWRKMCRLWVELVGEVREEGCAEMVRRRGVRREERQIWMRSSGKCRD